jgi:cytochrome P450
MTVNLADPATFHDAVPHEEFARLRREEPVHWTPTPFGTASGGFWSLTRFGDIASASRDPATFSNRLGPNFPYVPAEAERMGDNIMFNDPPEHGKLRRLVSFAFTPRMVSRFSGWIEERVNLIVDDLHTREACDYVPLVAVELPAQVICSVMGVPDDKRGQVVDWANKIFGRQDPEVGIEIAVRAIHDVMGYALELRDSSARDTEGNMISELAAVERDGVKITDAQYQQMVMSLLIAGFETTHTLIGQSMRMILEEPRLEAQTRAAVAAGETRAAVDEFLRLVTPAMNMGRHTTRDVELHGTTIKKGDTVLMWFVSGNRDDAVFENPNAFDPSRTQNHQSFGAGGPHYCVGSHLARLEVEILLDQLFTRGPKIRLAGEPERGWSVSINQLRSLPVVCE